MKTPDQLAAEAVEKYFSAPSSNNRKDLQTIIKSAIEEGIQAWLCGNPDSVLSRAAHASGEVQ